MKRIYTVFAICLMLMLAAAMPAAAADCPEQGSGAEGVAIFAEDCTECYVEDPVLTCNEEFTIELIGVDRDLALGTVTYSYEVLKAAPESPDLEYWVLGLDLEHFQQCLDHDKTLSDLIVSCSVDDLDPGMDCGLVGPDPKTQLNGMKFEIALGEAANEIYTITLDENALAPGFEIVDECVVAATQADAQDIQREDRPTPGYACVVGPVCVGEPLEFICPRSQGYWKNHPGAWPIDTIVLGDESYTKMEAIAIMRTPTRGDASIILARQLIAAKLNIENGSNPDPVQETIDAADDLLSPLPGRLPYGVRPYTDLGKDMLRLARVLDAYNNRWLTPRCVGNYY